MVERDSRDRPFDTVIFLGVILDRDADQVTKGSLSYLSSPCFSKNVLQSGVGIVH